jgi:hypothetical protein
MKRYIFWTVLTLIIAVAGYWMTNNWIPVADNENEMSDVIIRENNFKRATRSPDANSQPMPSLSSQEVGFPHQANKEAIAYNLNDPTEREQLADSLRAEGVTQEDIQYILKHSTVETSPSAIEGAEPQTYDLNDPTEREQLADSLRAEGIIEGDFQKIMRNSPENEAHQNPSHP